MQVFRAGAADVNRVAPLFDRYRQFYRREPDPELARRYLRERLERAESVVFLAVGNAGETLGFTQLYPTFCSVSAAPIVILYDLFVETSARRCGVGRALMEAAREFAIAGGAARLELSTARDNASAQALYESLGYVRDEEFFVYSLRFAP